MTLAWSLVLIGLGLFCWLGQIISTFAPKLAVRLGLLEPKADVDTTNQMAQALKGKGAEVVGQFKYRSAQPNHEFVSFARLLT